ncbi:MAG: spermidine/putrescine transporter ATP-binding protein [Verrucomicrobiales bacterium]|nr:spermidine/putrescine transporter ATP-binding protein [Verrucomicrobiales bacterium]
MVSIITRHLTKHFGTTVALDDVSLTIEAGEMFFLLGPSGCGKTTLLRHIAGFYTPDTGQLFFDSRDMTNVPAHRRNTAMMFQSYALWPHMTVGENVAFGLQERKLPRTEIEKRVQEALQMVRMGHLTDRKINQLSGGQQQRVALARSIAVRPDALLLDEPLSNLDARLRLEMRGEIRRICKEFGVTAVYVTHDQKEALHLADRLAVMEKGVISQVGSPRDVFRSPLTSSVASFIGEANFLPAEITAPAAPAQGQTTRSPQNADSSAYWTVQTAHGPFTGRLTDPAWQPAAGEKATLCLRPEALRFFDQPSGAPPPAPAPAKGVGGNLLTGTLTESVYLGELAQYTIRDAAHRTFLVAELNPALLRPAEGSPVSVTVSPDDVMILRL